MFTTAQTTTVITVFFPTSHEPVSSVVAVELMTQP